MKQKPLSVIVLLPVLCVLSSGQLLDGTCTENPCGLNGLCIDHISVQDQFFCRCDRGFGGVFCELPCSLNCGDGQKCVVDDRKSFCVVEDTRDFPRIEKEGTESKFSKKSTIPITIPTIAETSSTPTPTMTTVAHLELISEKTSEESFTINSQEISDETTESNLSITMIDSKTNVAKIAPKKTQRFNVVIVACSLVYCIF